MNERTGATAVVGVLRATAVVAVATGALVVLLGGRAIPGGTEASPSVESVLRFYAVWWIAAGPALWRASSSVGTGDPRLRQLCFITTAGGLARLVAAGQTGMPHPMFQALTVVELVGGPLLAVCDERISRAAKRGRRADMTS
jgi:hypothetical protein